MKIAKKCVSILLAVLMVFACLPVLALASTETEIIGSGSSYASDGKKNVEYTVTQAADDPPEDYNLGDVDGDDRIVAEDARLALRAAVGLEKLTDEQFFATDVNADEVITAEDARQILRAAIGLSQIGNDNTPSAKPADSDPVVVLDADWTVTYDNSVALNVYFDDSVGLQSWHLDFAYDKDVFGMARNVLQGSDAMKVWNVVDNNFTSVSNTDEDGTIKNAGYIAQYLYSTEEYAEEGVVVNSEHFNVLTVYLTVEDAEAFAANAQTLSVEGYFDFGTAGKVSVSDSITKAADDPPEDNYLLGDVDRDLHISASDARLALRAAVGLEELTDLQFFVADVNADEVITAEDARQILRAAIQLSQIGNDNTPSAKPADSDPVVVLDSDWTVTDDNTVVLNVYFDDSVGLQSWHLDFAYDKDVFGMADNRDVLQGSDAMTVWNVASNYFMSDSNTDEDGTIKNAGYFAQYLYSTEEYAEEGVVVNSEHFNGLTVYLTVEDAETFAANAQTVSVEGYFDFGTAGKVSVSDSITKAEENKIIASGICGDNLTWTLDKDGLLTISGTGDMYNFGRFDSPWYNTLDSIRTVVIENGATSIGDWAFSYCDSLTSITIPDGVTIIGDYAFSYCDSLTSITIPNSVTSIGGGAFEGCISLTNITIPASVTTIKYYPVQGDGPGFNAYYSAFHGCTSLNEITVDENNTHYSSENGILYNKNKTTLLIYPIGKTSNAFSIPDSVTSIGHCAFSGCTSLTSVTIPDSVTSIGADAFFDCSALTSVTIPDSVKSIGPCAFSFCTSLTSVTIPDSVTSIGFTAFAKCTSLTSVTIPDSITSIGQYTYFYCTALTSVTIPDSVTSIGNDAFYYCSSLTDVYYSGSEAEWNSIAIGAYNDDLLNATIHILNAVITPPTCTEQGYTTYTCTCGDSYVADYVDALDHDYKAVVTAPTCTEQGFTTYTCDCGDVYIADYVEENGHTHTATVTTPATHLAEGVMTYTCNCGDTYTETIAKTTEHTYTSVVTAPTCTKQGYTTYTCECGDTYVSDYTPVLDHDYKAVVTAPTCTEQGFTTYTCSCGDTYVDNYTAAKGHTEKTVPAVAPTCTKEGLTEGVICADCSTVLVAQKKVAKLDHVDEDTDNKCDSCGTKVRSCDCMCHATDSFNRFFYKLIQFFRNLFGIYSECKCGVVHK